jgi:hypothetical protein
LIEQVEKIRALLNEEIDPAESWPVLRAHQAVKSLDSQLKELTDECHVQESKLGVLRRFHEMPPGATVLTHHDYCVNTGQVTEYTSITSRGSTEQHFAHVVNVGWRVAFIVLAGILGIRGLGVPGVLRLGGALILHFQYQKAQRARATETAKNEQADQTVAVT